MRGISEERLIELVSLIPEPAEKFHEFLILSALLNQCTELNTWVPIDENTPKDKQVLLFYPGHKCPSGYLENHVAAMKYNELATIRYKPTHWMHIPNEPE